MNKNKWILLGVILIVLIASTVFFFWKNNAPKNSEDYEATRTSQSENVNPEQNTAPSESASPSEEENNNVTSITKGVTAPEPVEEIISTFSTKIYNSTDEARQNNIAITCQALTDTIVENGATFSFCNTVGQATTAKGYQKADIFDNNGKKKKGLGGGNCQISTTLYNAVLAVPSLVVTERHKHSNYVPYIKEGKDAAVAYGSYDLKFRNDTGNRVKIRAEANTSSVTVTLYAMK